MHLQYVVCRAIRVHNKIHVVENLIILSVDVELGYKAENTNVNCRNSYKE